MTMKGIVSLGYSVCPICCTEHEDNSVWVQMRDITHPKLEQRTFTGFKLCPEHQKQFDDGFLAMVVVKAQPTGNGLLAQYNASLALRTGEVIHIRRTVAREIFNVPISDRLEFMWIDEEAAQRIKDMQEKPNA